MFMRASIGQLLDTHPEVQAVGIESPPYGELWSEGLYGLFLYVTEAVFSRRLDTVYFDPLSVKLLAKMDPKVRRGTMTKADMVEAAKADTTLQGARKASFQWNHNEADAYIIARSAARFWDFQKGLLCEEDLTPSEQHVFARTPGPKALRQKKMGLVFREDDRFFRFSVLTPDDIAVKL